jgi:hypothetical protein
VQGEDTRVNRSACSEVIGADQIRAPFEKDKRIALCETEKQ